MLSNIAAKRCLPTNEQYLELNLLKFKHVFKNSRPVFQIKKNLFPCISHETEFFKEKHYFERMSIKFSPLSVYKTIKWRAVIL